MLFSLNCIFAFEVPGHLHNRHLYIILTLVRWYHCFHFSHFLFFPFFFFKVCVGSSEILKQCSNIKYKKNKLKYPILCICWYLCMVTNGRNCRTKIRRRIDLCPPPGLSPYENTLLLPPVFVVPEPTPLLCFFFFFFYI